MADNYHAFLVRLWREDETAPWRVRVQAVQGDQIHLFASVKELTAFLNRTIEADSPPFNPDCSECAALKSRPV